MSTAFIFPGQGSQSVGMMNSLAEADKVIQETFNEASSVLDYDLWELVCEGPAEKLNATEFTQPAMLTAGVASWRAWLSAGGAVSGGLGCFRQYPGEDTPRCTWNSSDALSSEAMRM